MPLDILPTPPALPGEASPSGTSAAPTDPPPNAPAGGVTALLFGVMLAQTIGQAVPVAAQAAPLKTTPQTVSKTAARSQPLTGPALQTYPMPQARTGSRKGEETAKRQTQIPTVPAALPPVPMPALALTPAPSAQITPAAKTDSGNVMDTVPATGGEWRSPQQNIAPVEALQVPAEPMETFQVPSEAMEAVQVPTEPATPDDPGLASVPPVEVTPSQVVRTSATAAQSVSAPVPAAVVSSPVPAVPQTVASPTIRGQGLNVTTAAPASASPSVPVTVPAIPSAATPVGAGNQAALSPLGSSNSVLASVLAQQPQTGPRLSDLQNRAQPADNQAGKNAVSPFVGRAETTGPIPRPSVPVPTMAGSVNVQDKALATAQMVAARAAPEKPGTKGLPTSSAVNPASAGTVPNPTVVPPSPGQSAPVPSPAVTPMPLADRTQMMQQVAHGVEAMAVHAPTSGPQQVTLQLHPKDWGQLNVSVTMTPTTGADGKVSSQVVAHVVADNPAVKAALETHQADLRQTLSEVGLHLDRLTVTVQPSSAAAQAGLGQSRHESRGGDAGAGASSSPSGGASAQGGASGNGGSPSPYAAFAQSGQGGRQAWSPPSVPTAQMADAEADDVPAPVLTLTGRVDTRA